MQGWEESYDTMVEGHKEMLNKKVWKISTLLFINNLSTFLKRDFFVFFLLIRRDELALLFVDNWSIGLDVFDRGKMLAFSRQSVDDTNISGEKDLYLYFTT